MEQGGTVLRKMDSAIDWIVIFILSYKCFLNAIKTKYTLAKLFVLLLTLKCQTLDLTIPVNQQF